jgi:hypothetical protein
MSDNVIFTGIVFIAGVIALLWVVSTIMWVIRKKFTVLGIISAVAVSALAFYAEHILIKLIRMF